MYEMQMFLSDKCSECLITSFFQKTIAKIAILIQDILNLYYVKVNVKSSFLWGIIFVDFISYPSDERVISKKD